MPIAALRSVSGRSARTTSLVLIGTLFVLLLIYEALQAAHIAPPRAGGAMWAWYATYAFSGALFFGVGALVWLYGYASQRTVATFLFWFCTLFMFAFASLLGAALGDNVSTAIGASTSAFAVLCLFLLLLRFPRNLLPPRGTGKARAMSLMQGAATALCLLSASSSILRDVFSWTLPLWWYLLGGLYYGIVSLLIVLLIALAARRSPSVRTLQQTRLFFAGTLLSFVPILLLTVIPQLLHLEASVDGTRSMVFLVFFPIAMAYSLLRYELLVFDIYVRRVVTWVFGGVGIALLGYLLFATSSQLLGGNSPLLLACLVGTGVLSSPFVWWQARRLTERFFFPETAYYATRLRETHARQRLETFDLQLAAHQLALDVITTLRSPEARVFVLDEQAQGFRLLPLPQREGRGEQAQASLMGDLAQLLAPGPKESVPVIPEQDPSIALLGASRRPMFLSETVDVARRGVGLARYLKNRARGTAADPLLAPIKTAHGQLIGIVALSERGDRQFYAGPELEVLQHLLDGASSAIETARLYQMVTRQQAESRRELELAYEEQRKLNEAKDQFIIHVSHEIRTPLSEVVGYLDMLAASGEELDPELRALFVEKAKHGSSELQDLVERILDAAQSSFASPLPLHMEALALSSIVGKVLAHLDPQAAREHAIEVRVAESVGVLADAHAVQLILANLVSNALKYTPGGTPICVRAEPSRAGGAEVCVLVEDKGPGIPPSEAPHLFGKFARLQRDISGSIRGTGLGLYINKQLVENMGGRIWLESSGIEGEGSRFAFTLRRADVPQPTERSGESVLV